MTCGAIPCWWFRHEANSSQEYRPHYEAIQPKVCLDLRDNSMQSVTSIRSLFNLWCLSSEEMFSVFHFCVRNVRICWSSGRGFELVCVDLNTLSWRATSASAAKLTSRSWSTTLGCQELAYCFCHERQHKECCIWSKKQVVDCLSHMMMNW